MIQKKNKFDKPTVIKVLKGTAIAGSGAAIIYFLEAISIMEFGAYTGLVVALAAVLINSIKEFIRGE